MPIVVVLPEHGHGHVHIHLQRAHLTNVGHRADPFIHIKLHDEEWTSNVKENAGQDPEWHLQHAVF